jgi:hypothetical protein
MGMHVRAGRADADSSKERVGRMLLEHQQHQWRQETQEQQHEQQQE